MDNFAHELGKIMKKHRDWNKTHGKPYKRAEIAKKIGIPPVSLNHYEKGDRGIQFDIFFRWCLALEINPKSVCEYMMERMYGGRKNYRNRNKLQEVTSCQEQN